MLRRAWLPAHRPTIVPVHRSGRNIMSGPAGLTVSSRTSTLQPTVFHVILLLFTPSAHLHRKHRFMANSFLGKYAILGPCVSCCFKETESFFRHQYLVSLLHTIQELIVQLVRDLRKEMCPSGSTEVSC